MNDRIPTLYLNENVAIRVVDLLLNLGIKAEHTITINNRQATDEFQLQYAADRNYILVSHNRRHFRRLHRQWIQEGKSHSGILVMGCGEPEYLVNRLNRFFKEIYPDTTSPFCQSPPA